MKVVRFVVVTLALLWSSVGFAQGAKPAIGSFDYKVPLNEIVSGNQLAKFSQIYADDEALNWRIVVPRNYNPINPPGVFVYISPMRTGKPPPDWPGVFERQNMIYISAHRAGNRVPVSRRMANSVLALILIRDMYVTDEDRYYVSGFSGGGRTATILIETLPNIFNGALFIGGARKWQGDQNILKEKLARGSYVFLAGNHDQAKMEIQQTYRQYRKAGVERVKLMIIRDLGHSLPKARQLDKALTFLNKSGAKTEE